MNDHKVKKDSLGKAGFWSYLSQKELTEFPSKTLRWWLLMILVFIWTVEQFERAKMGPVLVYLLEDFGTTLQTWGIITAVGTILGVGGAYFASIFADKLGRKPLIVWPIFIYFFIAVGIALAPNFATVATLHIIGGVVVAVMYPVIQAAVSDISPRMGRAIAYAWLSLAFILGSLSSNWAGAIVIPIWPGWRPQFWVAAVIAILTFIIAIIFFRDLSQKLRNKNNSQSLDIGYESGKLVYKDWRMWALGFVLFLWTIFYVTAAGYMPLYFNQYYGIEPASSASLTNVFWIFFVFSVFISGWVSDKLQLRKIVVMFGGISTGVSLFVLASLPSSSSVTTIGIILAATGFFSGFIYPAWCALLSENAENISSFGVARAFGIAIMLQYIGQCLLHFILPVVVEQAGWATWFFICGIVCILIAVCASLGRGPWFKSNINSL